MEKIYFYWVDKCLFSQLIITTSVADKIAWEQRKIPQNERGGGEDGILPLENFFYVFYINKMT